MSVRDQSGTGLVGVAFLLSPQKVVVEAVKVGRRKAALVRCWPRHYCWLRHRIGVKQARQRQAR